MLVATGRMFDKIVNAEETHEIEQIIAEGEYYGMQTFDQSLLDLYARGVIELREALAASTSPHDLRLMIEQWTMTQAAQQQAAARGQVLTPAIRGRERSSGRRSSGPRAPGENGGVTAVPPRLARFFEPDSPTQQLAGPLRAGGHPRATSSAAACATRSSTGTHDGSTSTSRPTPGPT